MPWLLLVVLLSSLELPDFARGFGTGGGAISKEGIGIILAIKLATGLHAYLTQFLERVNVLGGRISREFLMPQVG